MPIIPWRPFFDLEKWFEEEWPEEWFEKPRWQKGLFPMVRAPKMDISETEKEIIAEVELPGVDPKNIEVEVKDNVLSVAAEKKDEKEEKKKGYYRKEISRGFYKRAIPLPVEVIGEKTNAEYQDGILKVIVPKVKPGKPEKKKAFKVKVKEKKAKKE